MCSREAGEHIYMRQVSVPVNLRAKVYRLNDITEFASSDISTVDLPPYLCLIWLYGCSEDIR